MMRTRHNKKRNTAFVYEALIVEATVAILKKDHQRRDKVVDIVKKYFNSSSVLKKELDCYRSLYEGQNLNSEVSKRIIREAKLQQKLLNINKIFETQTDMIRDINKDLGVAVFNNFVPNYKTLASIAQMFSDKTSPKNQIILENIIIENMATKREIVDTPHVDKTLYNTFVGKFNNKYDTGLLDEQKELLTHYISSFADNAVSLKVFLNEEIMRLKIELKNSKNLQEFSNDQNMLSKANAIVEKLESFSDQPINDSLLLTVLKTQALVKEINTNGKSN